MFGHAIAERRIRVVRAGSSSRPAGVAVGVPRHGCRRRPEVERALVRRRSPRANRSDMCSASASLNSTSAISLPLAPPLQDRQQLAVVADRLVQRVLLASPVAGAWSGTRRPCPRRPRPASGGRAARRPRPRAAGVWRLEPLGRAAVQAVRVLGHQRAVRGLLDQRVLEAVLGLGPPPALADQVQPLQLGERRRDLAVCRPATASSSGRPNCRPSTDAAMSALARVRRRAGRSGPGSPSRRSAGPRPRPRGRTASRPRRRAPARRRRRATGPAPPGRTGCPRRGSRIRRSSVRRAACRRRRARAAARGRRRPRAPPATSSRGPVRELARRGLLHPPRRVVALGRAR